ncbi:MAG: hypothetical protein ACM3UY_07840 [Methanocella sp.]
MMTLVLIGSGCCRRLGSQERTEYYTNTLKGTRQGQPGKAVPHPLLLISAVDFLAWSLFRARKT